MTDLKQYLEWQDELDEEIEARIRRKVSLSELCLALYEETSELARTTGWRWWKHPEANRGEMLEEFVDILHFLLSFALHAGFTSEQIEEAYRKKRDINFKRIGYV